MKKIHIIGIMNFMFKLTKLMMALVACISSIAASDLKVNDFESIKQILITVYDKIGINLIDKNDPACNVNKIASAKLLVEFYDDIPTYLHTQDGTFSLPVPTLMIRTHADTHKIKTKIIAALEKKYTMTLHNKSPMGYCIPPYCRFVYELSKLKTTE